MPDPQTPLPSDPPVVIEGAPTHEVILARVEEVLARQTDIILDRTRQMVLDTALEVANRHASPLAEQAKAVMLETLAQALDKEMGPFLDRTRRMLLDSIDEVAKKHSDPFLDRTREVLLETVAEFEKRYTTPLLTRLEKILLETVDQVLARYKDSFHDLGQQIMSRVSETVREQREFLTKTLTDTVTEPVNRVLTVHVPNYMQWLGLRTIDVALTGIFFCLAAVFISLGFVRALEELGMRPFGVYLVVGGVDLLLGLVFFLRRRQAMAKTTFELFGQKAEGKPR